jgi:CelD/BcsL family acetyltransferase involved in cellulose biosynthesis
LPLTDPRWLPFVASSRAATAFHHPAWAEVLSATYGFPAFAAALLEGAEIVAGAPVLEVRGPARGRRWISLPYTDSCAPLARTPVARESFLRLLGDAGLKAPTIELRARIDAVRWHARADAVVHELDLVPDPEELRRRFSRSQVVRNIARAEREGVEVRSAAHPRDLETFYALHLATRRRQGVPVQPHAFFERIWADLIERGFGSILIAEVNGRPVATALFLAWNGTTIYKFGASDQAAWSKRPNHALFWSAISESCRRGDRRFDFGRSDLDNTGLRSFKDGWGAIERPLVYSTLAPGGKGEREGVARRARRRVIRTAPEWFCRRLGESLYRYAA